MTIHVCRHMYVWEFMSLMPLNALCTFCHCAIFTQLWNAACIYSEKENQAVGNRNGIVTTTICFYLSGDITLLAALIKRSNTSLGQVLNTGPTVFPHNKMK